ncbi:hypothetical protein SEUCBS140593_010111 [Sporothrix eucalyptigena]|uniref:Uncharacterized protein n=1 Tax=Sporothrix eucalyptigena TaxID=1812306 RepID=A0ABP0D1V8_9PEZI
MYIHSRYTSSHIAVANINETKVTAVVKETASPAPAKTTDAIGNVFVLVPQTTTNKMAVATPIEVVVVKPTEAAAVNPTDAAAAIPPDNTAVNPAQVAAEDPNQAATATTDQMDTATGPEIATATATGTTTDEMPTPILSKKEEAAIQAAIREEMRFNDADMTNYVNFLVDKHGLESDLKWQAVNVAPVFDAATLNKTPVYPSSSDPVDEFAPSLNVVDEDLENRGWFASLTGGFRNIHMPGRAALKQDERHVKLQTLNDYGEEDKKGFMGKTKTEIKHLKEIDDYKRREVGLTRKVAEALAKQMLKDQPVKETKSGTSDSKGGKAAKTSEASAISATGEVTEEGEVPSWIDGFRVFRFTDDGQLVSYEKSDGNDDGGEELILDEDEEFFDISDEESEFLDTQPEMESEEESKEESKEESNDQSKEDAKDESKEDTEDKPKESPKESSKDNPEEKPDAAFDNTPDVALADLAIEMPDALPPSGPALDIPPVDKSAAALAAAFKSMNDMQAAQFKANQDFIAALESLAQPPEAVPQEPVAVEKRSEAKPFVKRHDPAADIAAPVPAPPGTPAPAVGSVGQPTANDPKKNTKLDTKQNPKREPKQEPKKDAKATPVNSTTTTSQAMTTLTTTIDNKAVKTVVSLASITSTANQMGHRPFGDLEKLFNESIAHMVPISKNTTGYAMLDKIAALNVSQMLHNDSFVMTYRDSNMVTVTTLNDMVLVVDGDVKFAITNGGANVTNLTPKEVDLDNFLAAPIPLGEEEENKNEKMDESNESTSSKPSKRIKPTKFVPSKRKSPVKTKAVVPTELPSMSKLKVPKGVIHLPVSGRGFVRNIEAPSEPVWTELGRGRKASKNKKPVFRSEYKRVHERRKGDPPLLPEVPKGALDASGLMIGISTTYSRLHNNDFAAIDDWARWLTDGQGHSNGAFLFLVLHRPRNNETAAVRALMEEQGLFFDIFEDWGHVHEGDGGGPKDVHPLPVVPDADAIRYANMLGWMRDYTYTNFGSGRPDVLYEAQIQDNANKTLHKTMQAEMWNMLVYALLDDDIFVPDMNRLVAKLREHQGLLPDFDPHVALPDSELRHDKNMWLGFPSDPWSDWDFHNGTTLYNQYWWEQSTFGRPVTTSNLGADFLDPNSSAHLPTAYGGRALFLSSDLAHRIADLTCMRCSLGDNLINTVFKANRAAFHRGEHPEAGWDEQIYRCVVQSFPDVRLRLIPSYYSPSDAAVYGSEWQDATKGGDFEKHLARLTQYNGGTHPLVMHNYRTWHNYDVGTAHQVTTVCGSDCFLQRFVFADNWVLTNGHSLTHYDSLRTVPLERRGGFDGIDFKDLGDPAEMKTPSMLERYHAHQERRRYYDALHIKMEHAERPRDAHALDWTGQQKTYRIVETTVAPDGTVIQAYLRRGATNLRNLAGIGGQEHFDDVQRRRAIPGLAMAGLDGSLTDQATEAPAPDKDELFVVLWKPAEQDKKGHLPISKGLMHGPTALPHRGMNLLFVLCLLTVFLAYPVGAVCLSRSSTAGLKRFALMVFLCLFVIPVLIWIGRHVSLPTHAAERLARPLKGI